MGSFDANCCLTGLPMHQGDPVRAALILRTQSEEQRGSEQLPLNLRKSS